MYQGRIASSPVCCNPGRFLDKRRFTRINLRKQHAFRYPTCGGSRGAAGGGGAPTPLFLGPPPPPPRLPSPSLSQGLDPALPTTDFPATSEERAEKFPIVMTSH